MKRIIFVCLFISSGVLVSGQVTENPNTTVEQQLENVTENNEDLETEDDAYLQEMIQFQKNPVNLNTADEALLKELRVLSPIQIENFLAYRSVLGNLISIYELQSVPGWDLHTIHKLRPYLTVSNELHFLEAMRARLHNGDNAVLIRVSQIVEKSKGFLLDSGTANNFYPGSPQKILLRYKYNYKNGLQYGLVAEKDAGEQFFKGSQRKGFDFYSVHFFMKNAGIIKSLALGDFTVNLAQGLTQWMSLAFKKGPDVLATKRQSSVLRPYNSAGEIFFHRGAGITIGKNNWQATLFGSYRNIDANFVTDTLQTTDDFISSFQTSGYHRTKSEVDDKAIQRQLAFGGNISYRIKKLQIGLNGIQYQFRYPLVKDSDPYNLFALSGKSFGNYSADYGYTYKNFHVFGEVAVTDRMYPAFVNGLLISTAANIDMSFFYRNISKRYQSLYTSAFTENTFPTNEKGFFTGISIKPNPVWRIDAYTDMYQFPWLKYRVNAPTSGSDYLVQLTYKPTKQLEIYTRFKRESKYINDNPGQLTLSPVIAQLRQNWRTQINYKLNTLVTLRSRAEVSWYDKRGWATEQGFLMYADVLFKPMLRPFSGNIRLLYFETDGYNSRLYAYENDVLYSFSIPVFYDKGYRYYVNVNYDVGKRISVWAKWAQFIYPDKKRIGSGLDEIHKSRKSEIKLQAVYKF